MFRGLWVDYEKYTSQPSFNEKGQRFKNRVSLRNFKILKLVYSTRKDNGSKTEYILHYILKRK